MTEKQNGLKELMLIMGLPNFLNWIGYLTLFTVQNLILILIVTLVLKMHIFTQAAFQNTATSILFVFLLCFIASLSSLAMLLSCLFQNTNQISILNIVLFTILSVPLKVPTDFREFGPEIKAWVLMSGPSAMGISLQTFLVYEDMGVGFQWSHMFKSPGGTAFAPGFLLLAMIFQTVVHITLGIYFERIFPGEYGAAREWYYPIEGLFRKPTIRVKKQKEETIDCQQKQSPYAVPCISMENVTKVFGHHFVVLNNLSLTINENEITILLGSNGAGKSTLMSILAGMKSATAGTAYFKTGYELKSDMSHIRSMIGFCPQKKILFDVLTVRDHLIFFGVLKGLSKFEARQQANSYMGKVGLLEELDTRAWKLSVGMQRKLNLGIALAGGAEIVLLDEPTAGTDPASRREISKILLEERVKRTIFLTTHLMDEADMLADRVAILHEGQIKCSGMPYYLKETFQSAYKLVNKW